MFAWFKKKFWNLLNDLIVTCYLLLLGAVFLGDRSCGTTLLLLVTCYFLGSIYMPIPFGKAFSYGTFLQYLRSQGLNALPCRPTVSREHWLRGLFLLTYCTNEPISARISAILHRLLHGCVAALFLSSDSS